METVAIFHSPFPEKFGIPRQSSLVAELPGEVHLTGIYRNPDALRGLEEFEYIWLIWGFSANPPAAEGTWKATVRPPRLGGNRRLGVFATRSPFRPNPLGLSSVRLERVDFKKGILYVRGADLMDGTPVYDIKPYLAYTDAHPEAAGGFTDRTEWQSLEVVLPEKFAALFPPEELSSLKAALALDPRPHYQDDPQKAYGLTFAGRTVRFVVSGSVLTVTDVRRGGTAQE